MKFGMNFLQNMLKIKYSKKAEANLKTIFLNIFKDKPNSASEYLRKVRNFIELLPENPHMGIECKHKDIDKKCRVLIYGNYMILYKINNLYISILEIRSTKQSSKRRD